ncbi:MAG: response regulator [Myxococcales bacterium]|nr:response regulator [Myxococcales bacterium]
MARILVVDDSQLVIRYLEHTLGSRGHVVEALDSFVQLAHVVRERPPALLILDLHMPALSGLSTARIVRAHESDAIPILLYSSAAEPELQAAAREVRARGFLQKGCESAILVRTVEGILGARQRAAGGGP